MANFHQRALLHLLLATYGFSPTSAFTGTLRSSTILPPKRFNGVYRLPSRQKTLTRVKAKLSLEDDETTNSIQTLSANTSNIEKELITALETNDLEKILSYLQSHASSISSLSNTQIQTIFEAIELATAESDDNTVNKRAIEDANIASASSGGGTGVEFRALDRVRSQMTKLYRLLRDEGKLNVFGAIGREPPSSLSVIPPPEGPTYPTSGSKIITATLLEEITNMEMINLTPQPTNFLLYGGAALAVLEGIASLYYGINFNLLVVCTLLLALMDQILVSGAVFETALRIVKPEMTTRITKHEAGHFLMAYLLGCPVEGVVLSTWAALNDGRFGGRSSRAVSAGTSYYDLDLSEQIAGVKPLTRQSIDRYSIIVMGGIAAEAVEYGRADGGAGDEEALVRFLRSLNPNSRNAVSTWSPELIRNQARWGATQAVLLLKEYKPCYDALVGALESGADLGQCIVAIEEAAAREGLGWLRHPMGRVLEEGEFGKWVPIDDEEYSAVELNGSNGDMSQASVPTYGEDPITSTEEFLQMYREKMEKKLASIDEALEEMDNKTNGDTR
ncbi:hypothetical protein ACHAXR_011783 [Thalassiosira sp. AJA248-18]